MVEKVSSTVGASAGQLSSWYGVLVTTTTFLPALSSLPDQATLVGRCAERAEHDHDLRLLRQLITALTSAGVTSTSSRSRDRPRVPAHELLQHVRMEPVVVGLVVVEVEALLQHQHGRVLGERQQFALSRSRIEAFAATFFSEARSLSGCGQPSCRRQGRPWAWRTGRSPISGPGFDGHASSSSVIGELAVADVVR